jgi:DNA topoisomerase-1
MSSAKLSISKTQISISKLKEYYFESEISSIIFDGFLKVYNLQNIEEDKDNDNKITNVIPKLNEKLKLINLKVNQDYDKPPTRYNEASLVNKLDPKNLNIGRPSTYAAIITKIQERGYVDKKDNEGIKKTSINLEWNIDNKDNKDNKKIEETEKEIFIGKDTNKLNPTAIGKLVTDFLVSYFPEIMDYKFTSNMEKNLDTIAEGKLKMIKLLGDFYNKDFHPIITKLKNEKIKYVDKEQKTIGTDENGNNIIVTIKRYGPVVLLEKDGKIINIAPIKNPLTLDTITKEDALKILSYPKSLGKIDDKEVKLYKGKYGLYAKYGDKSINLTGLEENDITLDIIKEKSQEKKSKNLWEGKEGKTNYVILEGPYGKYINIKDMSKKPIKQLNIKLPSDIDIKTLTLDSVKKIIEDGKVNKYKYRNKNKN